MLVRAPFGDGPVLSNGMGSSSSPDPNVIQLQTDLAVLGYMPSSTVDGVFGNQTASALVAFQNAKGLSPIGYTDQATWDALSASSGNPVPTGGIAASAANAASQAAATVTQAIGLGPAATGQNWPMIVGISVISLGGLVVLFGLFHKKRSLSPAY